MGNETWIAFWLLFVVLLWIANSLAAIKAELRAERIRQYREREAKAAAIAHMMSAFEQQEKQP